MWNGSSYSPDIKSYVYSARMIDDYQGCFVFKQEIRHVVRVKNELFYHLFMLDFQEDNMKKYLSIIFAVVMVVVVTGFITSKKSEASSNSNSGVKRSEMVSSGKKLGDFKVQDIDGKEVDLSAYEGKVVLIVNVASQCGYTRQYKGLEDIYKKYKDQGLVILGFPCNDFGGQEPGSNEEIKDFCSTKFSVTFPMMDKVKVLGEDKSPLFAWLTDNSVTGKKDIKWNFEKFLINKKGEIVERFVSKDEPDGEKITGAIEKNLNY